MARKKFLKEKVKMAEQDPKERIKNFKEVALGYSLEEAVIEANRCLQCNPPFCVPKCPVEIDIPGFIKKITEKDIYGALDIINKTSNLPAICGRVCPQEEQCEMTCIMGKKFEPVAIGRLERFVADYVSKHPRQEKKAEKIEEIDNSKLIKSKYKVAIIGSGPAGLTAAIDLAKMGYKVTIFEALHEVGGVLLYGIPEFRLPKSILKEQLQELKDLGVDIKVNMVIGKTLTINQLKEAGYKAIFIGVGAGLPSFMNIEGENLNGVYSANEFLTRINLMRAYEFPDADTPIDVGEKVAVVGAGNVAMDAARSALRLKGVKEVHIIYRRSEKEMTARVEEYHHAIEEGIIFHWLTNPVKLIGDEKGNLKQVECIKMKLGEPDSSGRRRPIPIEGSNFTIDIDTFIVAIGTKANPVLLKTLPELKLNKWGYIQADEKTGATSIEGVYAGGDIVTGAATVILAMGAGKNSARAIDEYITNKYINAKL